MNKRRIIRTKHPKPAATASAATPFQLSRLYAQGWLAGMETLVVESLADIAARGEEINPYRVDVERGRWMQGFTEAAQRGLGR